MNGAPESRWDRFWFRPEAARNLAAARIIIALHALWILLSRDLPGVSALPSAFWTWTPQSLRWRYLLFEGHAPVEYALQLVAVAALIAVLVGWYPRVTCLVAAAVLYHLAPLETQFWTSTPFERGLDLSVLALVTLAAAPCADTWAVGRRPATDTEGGAYHWPLALIQLFIAQVYLFSGYAKLMVVGVDWVAADKLRRWFLVSTQSESIGVFTTLGQWVADHPSLCLLAGIGGLSLDLGFVLAVFWRRSRRVLIPLAVFFHVGILFTMNIAFLNLPQLAVFVNWDWVARRVARRGPAPAVEPATA